MIIRRFHRNTDHAGGVHRILRHSRRGILARPGMRYIRKKKRLGR